MRQTLISQQASTKVVPFTGQLYQQAEELPKMPSSMAGFSIVGIAACFLLGLVVGSISAYNSPEQVQLRQLQAQSEQLHQLKKQLCEVQ